MNCFANGCWLYIVLLSLTGNEKDVTMHHLIDEDLANIKADSKNVNIEPACGRLNRKNVGNM